MAPFLRPYFPYSSAIPLPNAVTTIHSGYEREAQQTLCLYSQASGMFWPRPPLQNSRQHHIDILRPRRAFRAVNLVSLPGSVHE